MFSFSYNLPTFLPKPLLDHPEKITDTPNLYLPNESLHFLIPDLIYMCRFFIFYSMASKIRFTFVTMTTWVHELMYSISLFTIDSLMLEIRLIIECDLVGSSS